MRLQASFPVRGRTTICASPLRQGSGRARTMTRYVDRCPGQVVHCADNLSAGESLWRQYTSGRMRPLWHAACSLPQGSNGQTLSKERPGCTITIYPIPGYPTVCLTTDGAQMTIRPMVLRIRRLCWTFPQYSSRRPFCSER